MVDVRICVVEDPLLFIGKKDDLYCRQAIEFIKNFFKNMKVITGTRDDSFPEELMEWRGDYIISYLSPWIIPQVLLANVKKASINFHPGPPEYPGIGCTNFAIYNNEKEFGITCHHMNPKVDTGRIIAVKRFPLFEGDSVFSLTQRCYAHILALFYDIVSLIISGKRLPESYEVWKREPYKRKELNEL